MYTFIKPNICNILAALIIYFAISCKPGEIIEESTLTITLDLKSNLPGKNIVDATEVKLSAGQSDLFSTSVNGKARFEYTIISGQIVDFEITALENEGHKSASKAFGTSRSSTIVLEMKAKEWKEQATLNTKIGQNIANGINYIINNNLNLSGTTDSEGKGIATIDLNTDIYNNPQTTPVHFKFYGNNIKTIEYERSIIPKIANNFDFDLTKQTYQHTFTVNTASSIAGETPKLDAAVGSYDHGSGTTSFSPSTGVISFISEEEKENVSVSVSNVPGHNNGNISVANTGSALKNGQTVTLTLEGLIYNASQPIYVSNNSNPLSDVTVTYDVDEKKGNVITGTNGKTNINVANLSTDEHNIPLTSYPIAVALTKTGFQTKNENFNMQEGSNTEKAMSMNNTVYTYVVKGTGSPNNAHATVWRERKAIIDTRVANGVYLGTKDTTINTLPVDSIVFTSPGYIKEKIGSTTLQPGDNTFNFILELVPVINTYNIKIETLDDRLENYITTGTIEITTTSDQTKRTIPIDNDGITDIVITGPYEKTENVDVKIYNNTTHTNGTFALLHNGESAITGKIGSRINLPGYINHNLNTTLDEIDDPIGTYASMLSDESKNNSLIMESINDYGKGVCNWTPTTVTFINLTRDPESGEYLTQSRIDRQQAALQFFVDRNITSAGKTLYNTNGIIQTATIPEDPTGNVVMYRADNVNAGNTRLYTSTNKYKAATAHTKDSDTPAKDIDEIGESLGINDNSSGNNIFAFIYNAQGQVSDFSNAGKTVRVAAYTYQPADFKK